MHLTSFANRIKQTDGCKARESMKQNSADQPMNYFTQYKRVHGKLGYLLGSGSGRSVPVRQSYNVFTGNPDKVKVLLVTR